VLVIDFGEVSLDGVKVTSSDYAVIPLDYKNNGEENLGLEYNLRAVKIEGAAVFTMIGGPPKTGEVHAKPGFGGVMFANSKDQLET